MQLHDALPRGSASSVAYAGSVKEDGTFAGHSLYNNKPFREKLNASWSEALAAKQELRGQFKRGYGDVPCLDTELDEVKTLFARGEYKIMHPFELE